MTEIIKYLNHKVNGNTITYPIGTELKFIESNDDSLLIQTEKTTLDKILPLKVNQEIIDNNTTSINSLNDINKQGLYYISKTNITGQPNNITVPFNLLVLTNGNSFRQILFKEEKIYIRNNISSTWSAALAEPFTGSSSSNPGIKGLVPAPKAAKETDNYFLKSNGNWVNLNGTFARLGESETFTGTPIFSKGFTSQGTTASTFANTVSITASDPTNGKALTVSNGISAGSISATGTISTTDSGNFGSINIKKDNTLKASIDNNGKGAFNSIDVNNTAASIGSDGKGIFSNIETAGKGSFGNININNTTVIDNSCKGAFSNVETTGSINIKKDNTLKASIDNNGEGTFSSIKIKDSTNTPKASIDNNGKLIIENDNDIKITYNSNGTISTVAAGAVEIKGGLLVNKQIYSREAVYNAVWNDLADSIIVNKDAEIEAGYCYCLKDNKYVKSSKYLDNGIIGIHSDTYGFKMGDKIGEKQLDCAVAGFVLAYVDKDYLPGTALTCAKDGRLTKIKSKDKQRFPEKIVATYWKDEPAEEWGSDNRKIKVNGRKWVKIK